MKFWRVDEPLTARVPAVTAPLNAPVVPDTLVNAAIEAKRFVEVELVVVLFVAVKAWSVVDPVTARLPPKSEVKMPFTEKRLVEVEFEVVEF